MSNGAELKADTAGTYFGELSPGGGWRWNGTGLPTDDWVAVEQQAEVTPLVNPAAKRHHVWAMNSADCAFKTDLSGYPGLTYGKLLTLPTAEVQRIYAMSP